MPKTINPEIHAALTARKPEIAARYERIVRATFDGLVGRFGQSLKGIYSAASYPAGRTFREVCGASTRSEKGDAVGSFLNHFIDDEKLARNAQSHATMVVEYWEAKLNEKLGELDEATVQYMGGDDFLIDGTRGGHRVSIRQSMIINVSPLGKLFNQWPALLYVDGKKVSAAAYKRMFA